MYEIDNTRLRQDLDEKVSIDCVSLSVSLSSTLEFELTFILFKSDFFFFSITYMQITIWKESKPHTWNLKFDVR